MTTIKGPQIFRQEKCTPSPRQNPGYAYDISTKLGRHIHHVSGFAEKVLKMRGKRSKPWRDKCTLRRRHGFRRCSVKFHLCKVDIGFDNTAINTTVSSLNQGCPQDVKSQDRDETRRSKKRLETASRPRRSRPRLHLCSEHPQHPHTEGLS